MRKLLIRLGSIFGLLAVILGAFGAHALEKLLEPSQLETFETGVRYQFYHALAILAIGVLCHFGRKKTLQFAAWFFSLGIFLFSGSIYLLSTRTIHHLSVSWLGPMTPLGGLLLMAGWVCLFLSTYYHFDRNGKSG